MPFSSDSCRTPATGTPVHACGPQYRRGLSTEALAGRRRPSVLPTGPGYVPLVGIPFVLLTGPTCLSESAVWEPAKEIQKQQRVAEAVGGVHELLPVLLQVTPGTCRTQGRWPWGPPHSILPLLGGRTLPLSHSQAWKPSISRGPADQGHAHGTLDAK